MKSSETQCVVTGPLKFILLISRIAGLAPLKFERVSNGWRVTTSKIASIYGKILVVTLCFLPLLSLGFSLVMRSTPFYLRTTSDRIVTVFTLMLALSVGLVGSFAALERMSHMVKYLAQLDKINIKLNQYYKQEKAKEWKTFLCVIFIIVLGIVTIFMESMKFINKIVINHNDFSQLQVLYIFYYIMIEYIQLISVQFFLVCSSVLTSFRLLNDCLKFIILELQINSSDDARNFSKTLSKTLSRLPPLYSALCDVVEYVNQSYGVLLLQLLVVFLMYLIITPYNIFTKILKSKTSDITILIEFLWFLFYSCNLFMVVEPCHQTVEEVRATKILISKAMCHVSPSQHAINTELDLFYQHVTMRDVCYNPLKIFKIDRTLILSIASSITTYLVIVLSF